MQLEVTPRGEVGSTNSAKVSEVVPEGLFTALILRSRSVVAKGPFAHPSICFGRTDPTNRNGALRNDDLLTQYQRSQTLDNCVSSL